MVAYSFQRRFCDDVAGLITRQTIRAERKRHARLGEPVQLYFGMRTKHCRKLVDPDPICTGVWPIVISELDRPGAAFLEFPKGAPFDAGRSQRVSDEFAFRDGFNDADDFTRFWRDTHGIGVFRGVLIKWQPQSEIGSGLSA